MAYNGSGVFSIINQFIFGTVISETEVNQNFDDVAAGLSTAITKDGQTTITANLPMSGFKHTNVGNGVAANEYAALGQVQSGAVNWAGTAGGTADALTLTPSPAITAYAAGQVFRFIAGSTNTGAATLTVSGLTSPAIRRDGAALVAGNIVSGSQYEVVYDGTAFQLSQAYSADATFDDLSVTGTVSLPDNSISGDKLDGGTYSNFSSTGIKDNATSTAVTIDSSGNLGLGTTSPDGDSSNRAITINGTSSSRVVLKTGEATTMSLSSGAGGMDIDSASGGRIKILVGGIERARIDSSGNLLVGKTSTDTGVQGAFISADGRGFFTRSAGAPGGYNRNTNDGTLISFSQSNTIEGTISVSGTTVSYNGAHLGRYGQWATGQKPTETDISERDGKERPVCLRGTVLSNVDEECVWLAVNFTRIIETAPAVEAKDAVLDEDGNEIEPAVEAKPADIEEVSEHILYYGPGAVGDVIDYEFEGETYQATIVQEDNEQLNRVKVSDVAGDRNWAGVFQAYDYDDEYAPYDFYVARKGDFLVRVAAGVTVQLGDLLESAGDGTARPQIDQDLVRVSTLAKVVMTSDRHVYDDGSRLIAVEMF